MLYKPQKMKVLITGSGGYVGSSLLKALVKNNYEVVGHTRQMFDLQDQYATQQHFKNHSYDVVIHAAASGGSRLKAEDSHDLLNNLKCFYNLYDNKSKFEKLITFGSGAEFKQELSPYCLSKRSINAQIQVTPNFYNLRIFAVFDENELETRFIKSAMLKYLAKDNILIHKNKLMDFFAMQDLVNVVKYFIDTPSHKLNEKVVDCCYKQKYTLLDIANYINVCDQHKCNIEVSQSGMDEPYIGFSDTLPAIELTGLHKSIDKMYTKLK